MNRRTVLITGASSGIGAAFADVFAAEGFDLVITARREERLNCVKRNLEETYRVGGQTMRLESAELDVTRHQCDRIAARGLVIAALVSNGGYGIPGTFASSAWSSQAAMLQVM